MSSNHTIQVLATIGVGASPLILLRRSADENLPLTQSLSPAITAARGMGEGPAESADRL
jgi:hypothetical protein